MKDIDLTELLPAAVLRHTGEQSIAPFPIYLTLPHSLPKLPSDDCSMEEVIDTFIEAVASWSHAERPIRMAVLEKQRLEDIVTLLNFRPSSWIELRIEVQSPDETVNTFRELPGKFGFRYQEDWVTEDSHSSLISYTRGDNATPALLIWLNSHRGRHLYSLLIPISARQS
jgi:hypothetical protein